MEEKRSFMVKNTALFDLGSTLVHYFDRHEFPDILKQAITEVQEHLRRKGLLHVPSDEMWLRVKEEDYEATDCRVRPLEERLARIFQLQNLTDSDNLIMDLCGCFMKPTFVRSYCYEDSMPALKELKANGFRTALVSNTTWGSPAHLWREHTEDLGLTTYMDVSVFCRDVGWRKPAKQIFERTLEQLQAKPYECVFVGDDPRWDLVGPENVGILPIIIARKETWQPIKDCITIRSLHELREKLEGL